MSNTLRTVTSRQLEGQRLGRGGLEAQRRHGRARQLLLEVALQALLRRGCAGCSTSTGRSTSAPRAPPRARASRPRRAGRRWRLSASSSAIAVAGARVRRVRGPGCGGKSPRRVELPGVRSASASRASAPPPGRACGSTLGARCGSCGASRVGLLEERQRVSGRPSGRRRAPARRDRPASLRAGAGRIAAVSAVRRRSWCFSCVRPGRTEVDGQPDLGRRARVAGLLALETQPSSRPMGLRVSTLLPKPRTCA